MLAETIIKIAFNEAVENLSLPYALAPENVQIDWSLQKPFIRTYDQPVSKKQSSLGNTGANLHKGIFHIEVCYPGDSGIVAPMSIAELIIPTFKRGQYLIQDGNIISCIKAEVKTAYIENSWYILPIFVSYTANMEN